MKNIPIRHIVSQVQKTGYFEGFNIRNIEELIKGDKMIQTLHRHDFFFMLALQCGKGFHEVDFNQYVLQDNSIFILRPGQVHQLELQIDSKGFLIEFAPNFYQKKESFVQQRLRKVINKNFHKLSQPGFEKILTVLNCIFLEFITKQEAYLEVIKANLDIFLIELFRQSDSIYSQTKNDDFYRQERLEDLQELLETHITKLRQASQYADLLNLSLYQLNSITKNLTGKTVSELINQQILLEAKRYLLTTPNQIKDIAYYLGYEDVSYFIRFFKNHMGCSPEVYRQSLG